MSIIHILLHTPSHSQNWLKKPCQRPCFVPNSFPGLFPSSPFEGGHVIRERSQIASERGLAVTVPTYSFSPAHRTSVPGSMRTLLPTQQGRTGQTPGLCCDWHTTSIQGKCPGDAERQNLGNTQRDGLWLWVQIKTVLPTH